MPMIEQRKLTVFSFGNSILAAVMAVCCVVTVSRALSVFEFSWIVDLLSIQRELVIGAFLVALEVQWTRRLIEQHPVFSRGWLAAVAVEWGFLLIALLTAVWARIGPKVTLQEIPRLAELTAGVMMRPQFLEGLVLLFMVWGLSRYLAFELTALENIPMSVLKESQRGVVQEQNAARDRLWQDVLFFGGAMVFLSVFSVPIANFAWGMPMLFGTLGLEVLVFFLCGLGLFVIGRLMLLRAEWVAERTGIDSSVPRQWIGYGMVFVMILLVIAVVLPTEYTFQLLTSLNLVIGGISTFFTILWLIIVYAVIGLLSLILPAWGAPSEVTENPLPEEGLAQSLPSLPQGVSWETVIREILFWGIAVLVLVYVIRQILPLRFAVVRRLRRGRFFSRLLEFLRRLKRGWTVWKGNAARSFRESWQTLREDLAGRAGREQGAFLSLRGLDPRQSIRFYFFALLRRGAERGTVRRPSQTPREYSLALSAAEEQIRNELQELTLAFEESRYSRHAIGPEKASRVRKVWDTIRSSLRPMKREDGASRRDTSKEAPRKNTSGQAGGKRSE
jgi:hypothetical protein